MYYLVREDLDLNNKVRLVGYVIWDKLFCEKLVGLFIVVLLNVLYSLGIVWIYRGE